jgi:hypothetical protein
MVPIPNRHTSIGLFKKKKIPLSRPSHVVVLTIFFLIEEVCVTQRIATLSFSRQQILMRAVIVNLNPGRFNARADYVTNRIRRDRCTSRFASVGGPRLRAASGFRFKAAWGRLFGRVRTCAIQLDEKARVSENRSSQSIFYPPSLSRGNRMLTIALGC